MAKKSEGPGIQAAAGLIRYFEEEDTNNFKIPPTAIAAASLITSVGVVMMHVFWKF